jgi:hypothetical protein
MKSTGHVVDGGETQEGPGARRRRSVEKGVWRLFLKDVTGVHEDHPVGDLAGEAVSRGRPGLFGQPAGFSGSPPDEDCGSLSSVSPEAVPPPSGSGVSAARSNWPGAASSKPAGPGPWIAWPGAR